MFLPISITTKALQGVFVVLALVTATTAVAAPWWSARDTVLTSSSRGGFQIHGEATGLYPGKPVQLPLALVNRNGFGIYVKTVSVRIGSASGGACGTGNLKVTTYRGKLLVPARQTKRLVLTAMLARRAPEACVGATFPLRYSGTGVKR